VRATNLVIVGAEISGLAAAYFYRYDAGEQRAHFLIVIIMTILAGTPSATRFQPAGGAGLSKAGRNRLRVRQETAKCGKAADSGHWQVAFEKFEQLYGSEIVFHAGHAAFSIWRTFGEDTCEGINEQHAGWPDFSPKAPLNEEGATGYCTGVTEERLSAGKNRWKKKDRAA